MPIFGLSVGRGCTVLWCSDGVADCRCQRAPESEGASSTLGVGCLGSSAVGALCPRDTCEPSSEVSLSCAPLSRDSFPTSALRVLGGDSERGDWPEPCRPRRERVYGLTFRDEGASSPEVTTCEGAARARKWAGGEARTGCVVSRTWGGRIMLQCSYD